MERRGDGSERAMGGRKWRVGVGVEGGLLLVLVLILGLELGLGVGNCEVGERCIQLGGEKWCERS